MYLMFQAIAKGNWKAPLIICFVIMLFGLVMQSSINANIADQEEALRNSQPDAVSLDVFDRKTDVHVAKEVHVTARMNSDYNYRLIQERDGRSDTIRFMYVFFGPSQAESSRQARAAVILDRDDKDAFVDLLMAQSAEKFKALVNNETTTAEANLYTIAGTRDRSPDLKKIAMKAFEEQGLTKGPDFIYIEPFLEGRTAGLTPDYEFLKTWKYMWGSLLAFFALITGIKFLRRHKWQEKHDAMLAAKAYRKAHAVSPKVNVAAGPQQPNIKPPAAGKSANTNTAANLLEWAQNHPVLAIAAGFFVLVIIMPSTTMKLFPFLFAGGYMYLQFSAGQKLRKGISSMFGLSAPEKGTLPSGQVLTPPTHTPEPQTYHVPPVETPTGEPERYHVPPVEPSTPKPTPQPAPPARQSVLGRNTQDSPIQRKQSLGRRMGKMFAGKEDTSDPFRRLNRG
jgi:hypothetical protein